MQQNATFESLRVSNVLDCVLTLSALIKILDGFSRKNARIFFFLRDLGLWYIQVKLRSPKVARAIKKINRRQK